MVGMGWVSVVKMRVGLSRRDGVGLRGRHGVGLSGRDGVGLSRRDGGGLPKQWSGWGGSVVRMGRVSVVGMGWVSSIYNSMMRTQMTS